MVGVSLANSPETIPLLAADMNAVLRQLLQMPEIDADMVGLFGVSQATWYVPLVAESAAEIRFIVVLTGGVMPVWNNIRYEILSIHEGHGVEESQQLLEAYSGELGFDPRPNLRPLDIPMLYLLGEQDPNVPFRVNRDEIELLKDDGKDITLVTYANGFHGLDGIDFWPNVAQWQSSERLRKYLKDGWIPILVSLSALLALLMLLGFLTDFYTLNVKSEMEAIPGLGPKVTVITVIIFLVALLPITIVLLVNSALKAITTEVTSTEEKFHVYVRLRADLQRAVMVSGLIFGLGMLVTGAFLELRVVKVPGTDTQNELLLLYGAYLSLIVALIYVPVYVRLLAFGRDILNETVPLPPTRSDNWMEIYSKRKTVEGYLQLSVLSVPGVQAMIPILVPLVAGIIATFLSQG